MNVRYILGISGGKDSAALAIYLKQKVDERFLPDGYNVGINVNEVARLSVFHCHMHLIPRYKGDTPHPNGGVRGVILKKHKY
jgi:diadenosine tetraphosphate (Ap4A) HIT family hydrolase